MTSQLALGAYGAGSVMNAFGVYSGVTAENKAHEYNAKVYDNNAAIMEANASLSDQKAENAKIKGEYDLARFRERGEQLKGAQRAGFGASGVVVDSGSAEDVVLDTAEQLELDAMTMQYNTDIEVFDYQMAAYRQRWEGANMSAQAGLERSKTRSAFLPVATSILGSVSGLGSWMGSTRKVSPSPFSSDSTRRPRAEVYGSNRRSTGSINPFGNYGG